MTVTANNLRGINLGGWLVLERWMTPSVFGRYKAPDEYSLSASLGGKKQAVLDEHRRTFVTKKDFKWIADSGLQAVRLPVGYWLFGDEEPYAECASYVDKALKWADEYRLDVLLDLHAAPGSQNGEIHSGRQGETAWHLDSQNIDKTISILDEIARRWGRHPALWGIELLNEPSREIALSQLQDFYRRGYEAVRPHLGSAKKIIVSDAYRPWAEWQDFIHTLGLENILLDVHLYQLFSDADKALDLDGHISKALQWKKRIAEFGADKIIVGEWSAALHGTYDNMPPDQARAARDLYFRAQQYAFADCAGQFYWSYKTDANDYWNYVSLAA